MGEQYIFLSTQQRSFQDKVHIRQEELLNQTYELIQALKDHKAHGLRLRREVTAEEIRHFVDALLGPPSTSPSDLNAELRQLGVVHAKLEEKPIAERIGHGGASGAVECHEDVQTQLRDEHIHLPHHQRSPGSPLHLGLNL